jgi:phosphoribosylformylglycinamidine synthase
MPTYRVTVWNTENPSHQRLYFLEGARLEGEHVETLCRELLCDPVTEMCAVNSSGDAASFFEVTFLPGVTDSAAESLVRAAALLAVPLEHAASGERIEFEEALTLEALNAEAHERVNEVIQRFSLNAPITPPFVQHTQSSSAAVELIPIRNADDARLLEISKERRLALDLAEMQAVRAYYQREARDARDVELEMIAQTWSEHCVHKTFRARIEASDGSSVNGLLKTYIAAATREISKPWVRSAFVDNAGVIEFDEEFDLAFKVETHNHPSALEPFGGANTGVGGVIRDVLAMGAEPIANTDILCFGDLERETVPDGVLHPRRIQEGVVKGIEDYGNKMGIPTVNGAVFYHDGYTANPLVYCGCLGVMPASPDNARPLEARVGDVIVAIGGRTGRDGLRGATFSSLEMDTTTSEIASSSVQIGNPITEKQVQEVILRARAERLYSAMTDCGAGGFSSAVGEMGKHLGADVRLEGALLKYPGLRPWEIWLSEAQERMVLSVPPHNLERLRELCAGQDVELVNLGTFTDSRRLVLTMHGQTVGELDLEFLHEGIPQRVMQADLPTRVGAHDAAPLQARDPKDVDLELDLLNLLAHPNIRSREEIIRVYDHEIKGGTRVKPLTGAANHGPSDAAVLVPNPGRSTKGIALSNGICPQFSAQPYAMAWAAIDEAVRNAVAVGADPDRIAILDNFCWGNPTIPDRLGTLLETSRGCYDAALAYGTPFVSGKDSLYNEYTSTDGNKHAIPGTLLISAVGVVPDAARTVTMDFKRAGNLIYLLGETRDELGSSHYALMHGLEGGVVPQPVPDALERYRKLHQAIQNGWVRSCHDLSEGGFAVALAEMCIAGRLGATVLLEKKLMWDDIPSEALLFGESLSRFILEVEPEHTDDIEALFGDGVCDCVGQVTQNPDFLIEYVGAPVIHTDIVALELAWRGELAPAPVPPGGAQRAAPLQRVAQPAASSRVLILHANGTNRDHDAALAVELAGGTPKIMHVNELAANPSALEDHAMLIVPGGFSYGDDLGAGVLWALDLRERFGEQLARFVSSGRPVLGICNGFQTLVKAGVLPGGFAPRRTTLTYNAGGHFECRWVTLEANPNSKSPWLEGLGDGLDTPVAHGEGRFVCDDETLAMLEAQNLVALRYSGDSYPFNPNGSVGAIAGITNAAGNVLGLMPHPENHVFNWQHPRFHRGEVGRSGLALFKNGLKLASS